MSLMDDFHREVLSLMQNPPIVKEQTQSREFRSQLENIMPAEELLFDPTPGFGRYKRYLESAMPHPAKMNTRLLEFLIKSFTKEGEVVLDPMCGSGSTGVVAALHGRHAVQVDIEKKFVKWAEEAKRKVETQQTFTPKGSIINICGDARHLSKILSEADIVVTSPPYSNITIVGKEDFNQYASGGKIKHNGKYSENPENIGNLPPGSVDTILTSPPYSDTIGQNGGDAVFKGEFQVGESQITARRYSRNPKNLGNLPHGKVDAIITSPPYGESYLGGGDPKKRKERLEKAGHDPKDFLGGKARNAMLKHYPEVDAVITSPPFADGFRHNPQNKEKRLQRLIEVDKKGVEKGQKWATTSKKALERRLAQQDDGYGESKENIGNLPLGKVDAVITSPPYANQEVGKGIRPNRWQKIKDREGFKGRKEWKTGTPSHYSESKENIGNLPFQADTVITSSPYEATFNEKKHTLSGIAKRDPKMRNEVGGYGEGNKQIGNLQKETYLSAMLKVYMEMYKVLKRQGKAIIVIKPFIRQKKVVDLPYHTWLLLRQVGFKLVKLYKLRLKQMSFWRILYYHRFPHVPRINHEYVLVCEKVGKI